MNENSNMRSPSRTRPRTYFPFWALTSVFLTFVVMQGVNLKNVIEQRSHLKSTHAELMKIVPQALSINQTVENLGRDLLSMTNNKEARQIIADFKIAPSNSGK